MMDGYGRIAPYFGSINRPTAPVGIGRSPGSLGRLGALGETQAETLAFIDQVQAEQAKQDKKKGKGRDWFKALTNAVQTGVGIAQELGIELGPPSGGRGSTSSGGGLSAGGASGPGGYGTSPVNQAIMNRAGIPRRGAPKTEASSSRKVWPWVVGGVVLLVVAGGGVALSRRRRK